MNTYDLKYVHQASHGWVMAPYTRRKSWLSTGLEDQLFFFFFFSFLIKDGNFHSVIVKKIDTQSIGKIRSSRILTKIIRTAAISHPKCSSWHVIWPTQPRFRVRCNACPIAQQLHLKLEKNSYQPRAFLSGLYKC